MSETSVVKDNGKLAEIKRVLMPNGQMRTYYRGENQTWAEIVQNVILKDWEDYCNTNWISANHEEVYAPEKKVKAFLDRCAYLMAKDSGAVESEYKQSVRASKEIPVTECPPAVGDTLYSNRQTPQEEYEQERYEVLCDKLDKRKVASKKKRVDTRFDRITRIKRQYPKATLTWCIVDAANKFTYRNTRYTVPSDMEGYWKAPNEERLGGSLGVMDRILVVEDKRHLVFYDQSLYNAFICNAI